MIKKVILTSLSNAIEPVAASSIVGQYEKLISSYRKGDPEAALNASGKFAEHVLRGIEGFRTNSSPPKEVKVFKQALEIVQKDARLPESVRVLIPGALATLYDVRSKRGAAHVKEIDPRHVDSALAVQTASWVLAELVRLFHSPDEKGVAEAMAVLMRGTLPLIESFDDEHVVTTPLPCDFELLLQLARAQPDGLDRRALGMLVKHSPSSITRNLQKLEQHRHLHQTRAGMFHITGPGEKHLGEHLAKVEGVVMPASKGP